MFDRKWHWETIYKDQRPEDASWFQRDPDKSLELIFSVCVPQESRVIDVGGGSSLLVDKLLEAGYRKIVVLDISEKALQHVQNRLGSKASQVSWITCDSTQFKALSTFDLWHDRAAFHFLTEKTDRDKYISCLRSSLKREGYFILATFSMDGPDRCSHLPVRRYDKSLVVAELGPGFELVREMDEIHKTPSGKEQNFSYFMFKKTRD